MRDPAFDNLVRQGKSSSSRGSTLSSHLPLEGGTPPTVYLDGEFMAYLEGEEALENFRLFLSRGVISEISDANHRGGDGASCPLWRKVQNRLQALYDDDLRHQERRDSFASETQSYRSYTYLDSTVAVPVGGVASDGDASPRSDLAADAGSVASTSLVASGDVGADAETDAADETSTSALSPTLASAMSQSSGTLSRYSSDFYMYDDTTEEIQREQAADQRKEGERPSSAVQQADVATAEQPEARLPQQSPSLAASGHGASDERKRGAKQLQAGSVVSPPSPPVPKIV